MLEHARAALRYLGSTRAEELAADDARLSAILWRVAIVGEAAANLSVEGAKLAGGLPLREARRMRNLIIHEYPEIDPQTVAATVHEDFPLLIEQLEHLLQEPPE